MAKPTADAKSTPAWKALLSACRRLRFEPHDIAAQLDARGRYEVALTPEFPLSIKLFRYTSKQHTRGGTWHERLELFIPLDGPVKFRMGDQTVALERGDILVVDNLKVHHVVDFPGFDTRVVVVSFQPEFVYSLGSPSGDYTFLLPFYSKLDRRPHVLRAGQEAAPAHAALMALLQGYFAKDVPQFVQAGSKAFLLALLYELARHFRTSDMLRWEFMRQQQRSLRLKKLFDHIQAHYAEKLSVGAASKLVAMSPAAFMRSFKQVAGMTLVAYLNHVRLARAAQLLQETNRAIADIAAETGFADQSYFDRRFRSAFGSAPSRFRNRVAMKDRE
jgi:AraC-like DNA-binding protein/mannose-6-phosphate isomerase-like protein (cupin superfamily)